MQRSSVQHLAKYYKTCEEMDPLPERSSKSRNEPRNDSDGGISRGLYKTLKTVILYMFMDLKE